jgi:hypothetical protein
LKRRIPLSLYSIHLQYVKSSPSMSTKTALLQACRQGDVAALKNLYSPSSPVSIQELARASAEANQPSALAFALSQGASWQDNSLVTAAIENPALLSCLLDSGLPVDYSLPHQGSILANTAWFGKTEAVRLLLQRGANPETFGGIDCTQNALAKVRGSGALLRAAQMGRVDVVKSLLERGADVNERESRPEGKLGPTPMFVALVTGNKGLVDVFSEAGGVAEGPEK